MIHKAYCLSFLLGLFCHPPNAFAADGLRIFNVDVFPTKTEPGCQTEGSPIEIRTLVGSFQPSVSLGDVVYELARLAYSKQANVVYAIRFVSPGRPDGLDAAALAARCLQLTHDASAALIFSGPLTSLVRDSSAASATALVQAFETDFNKIGKPALWDEIPVERLSELRDLVVDPDSYESNSLANSCPFLASDAILFTSSAQQIWWVYSKLCRAAKLVDNESALATSPARVALPTKIEAIFQIVNASQASNGKTK